MIRVMYIMLNHMLCALSLSVLDRLGAHRPLRFDTNLLKFSPDSRQTNAEELFTRVDLVHLLPQELLLKTRFCTRSPRKTTASGR